MKLSLTIAALFAATLGLTSQLTPAAPGLCRAPGLGAAAGERCGPQGNSRVCADGLCCSSIGYCDRTDDHCGRYQGGDCQSGFGSCYCRAGENQRCGREDPNRRVCDNGLCCSSIGYCGSSNAHCGRFQGGDCQPTFGSCYPGNSTARCGVQGNNNVCAAGLCCSSIGWCGNTKDHCGPYAGGNCQVNFGRCD